MKVSVRNIFSNITFPPNGEESLEILANNSDFRLERIVSQGHVTPQNYWYDQPTDEWVILLSGNAVLLFEGGEEYHLAAGDYLQIPAHVKHKVTFTSSSPPCVWIALMYKPVLQNDK